MDHDGNTDYGDVTEDGGKTDNGGNTIIAAIQIIASKRIIAAIQIMALEQRAFSVRIMAAIRIMALERRFASITYICPRLFSIISVDILITDTLDEWRLLIRWVEWVVFKEYTLHKEQGYIFYLVIDFFPFT